MKTHKKKTYGTVLGVGDVGRWSDLSKVMASWGNDGTCRKQGTSVVHKQLNTDCLSISGLLKFYCCVVLS
jgi:hypothetical protein